MGHCPLMRLSTSRTPRGGVPGSPHDRGGPPSTTRSRPRRDRLVSMSVRCDACTAVRCSFMHDHTHTTDTCVAIHCIAHTVTHTHSYTLNVALVHASGNDIMCDEPTEAVGAARRSRPFLRFPRTTGRGPGRTTSILIFLMHCVQPLLSHTKNGPW